MNNAIGAFVLILIALVGMPLLLLASIDAITPWNVQYTLGTWFAALFLLLIVGSSFTVE